MTADQTAVPAGVATPAGRPEQGEHAAESVLSLKTGAGPEQSEEDCMAQPRPPARPAGYWERVRRIVDQAPPLTDTQRAVIRAQFHGAAAREVA